jgi:hypothetical protein
VPRVASAVSGTADILAIADSSSPSSNLVVGKKPDVPCAAHGPPYACVTEDHLKSGRKAHVLLIRLTNGANFLATHVEHNQVCPKSAVRQMS